VKQAWIKRPEAGTVFAIKFIVGFGRLCGRFVTRLALYPITAYFLIRRGPERRASRAFLTRVLDRRPTLLDSARHIYTFAAVILDRVFLLSERFKRFDVTAHGLDDLRNAWGLKRGVLVFGSHLGSFDALRVLAQIRSDVKLYVVIDSEQNPTITAVLNALNPTLAASIINARQDGTATAFAIKDALDQGALVTLLVDRARPGNPTIDAEFLGSPAPFPTSPWLLAATLKVPVVLCFGLYRGGNDYDLHFESFAEQIFIERSARQEALTAIIGRYAERLAFYTRKAPYNWFNFYDFWHPDQGVTHETRGAPAAGDAPADRELVRRP
jgi:predicted LPLAT superfamily acyltransferase